MLEAHLDEKIQAGDDHEECDDLRAKVITAKGKLEEASEALATCLSTKKVIQAKIDAVERARAIAQKGLDACLQTKVRLKTALEECHKRRDMAREKLQECLDRKVVLKKKIDECHERRDDALKKLQDCLTRKKELKTKIDAPKKKLVAGSSLLELRRQEEYAEAALQDTLRELRDLDADFNAASHQMTNVGGQMKRIVKQMTDASREEEDLHTELAEVNEKTEEGVTESNGEMLKNMQESWDSLKQIDDASEAAVASAEAAEASVAEADKEIAKPS